jgi:hypothetical protein
MTQPRGVDYRIELGKDSGKARVRRRRKILWGYDLVLEQRLVQRGSEYGRCAAAAL